MSVCNVVSKQKAIKAIWDSDSIEIYNLRGAEGPEHCAKYNWLSQRHYWMISNRWGAEGPKYRL